MRLLLAAIVALLAGCVGAPLREQIAPGFEHLVPPGLEEARYARYGGATPLSAVLAPVESRAYGFAWQLLAGEAVHRDDKVEVEVLFVGAPPGPDPPIAQLSIGVWALDPPDLEHGGRVDLLPALSRPPLERLDLEPDPDGGRALEARGIQIHTPGPVWLGRFTLDPGRLSWNSAGQAALLASVVYRAADGTFVRENDDMGVQR